MTCHDYEQAIVDLARGAADSDTEAGTLVHVGQCERCAARMRQEQGLTAGLRALARMEADPGHAGALEERLLAEFDRVHPGKGRGPWRLRPWVAAAAAIVVVVGLAAAWRTLRSVPPSAGRAVAEQVQDVESEFVAWPGAAALPGV